MAEKGHPFVGSTESQNNRLLWEQKFPGCTISTDLGHITKNEVENYFNRYCLQVLIM